MPIIAHYDLPSFERLKKEGETILSKNRAQHQDIRGLNIGLLNMMPDAALEATERQFFRLIGHSNKIAQFYLYPFTLPSIKRNNKAKEHIKKYYLSIEEIKNQGLDALIITGAHVEDKDLEKAPFYEELKNVFEWSYNNVTSTLCSCLATHAVLEFKYGKKRQAVKQKIWGVYPHKVINRDHPLMNGVNTRFDVPHSRLNQISKTQFEDAKLKVLVDSEIGVHLAVSEDLFRIVLFQGHPEYDTISLLKEYKREVLSFLNKDIERYPVFPENYLSAQNKAILNEFKTKLLNKEFKITDFPEKLLAKTLNNTWSNTTNVIINNWIGFVYQTTNKDPKKPFMRGIDPNNPLNLKNIG